MSTLSLLGSKYFLSFINDFSRRISIFFFKIKFETLNVFKIYKKEVENQNNKKIKVFKSDQGGEFTSRAFVRFCEE
jgi:transposase InsO family protein